MQTNQDIGISPPIRHFTVATAARSSNLVILTFKLSVSLLLQYGGWVLPTRLKCIKSYCSYYIKKLKLNKVLTTYAKSLC